MVRGGAGGAGALALMEKMTDLGVSVTRDGNFPGVVRPRGGSAQPAKISSGPPPRPRDAARDESSPRALAPMDPRSIVQSFT